MRYVLLQKALEVPAIEKLKTAFRGSGVLTEADAHVLGRDAFGILVKNLTAEKASLLHSRLLAVGVETELMPEKLLPQLPQTKFVRKLQVTEQALILHDALGRPFPLEWQHVMMIAAGNVRMQEFKRIRTEREVTQFTADGMAYETTEVDYSSKEESNFRYMLEIIVSRAVLRYTVEVDKSFLGAFLGMRFDRDLAKSFGLTVRDLLQFIPHAATNRGAYYLRENSPEPFSYPSKNAFYEEITWLLWRMQQSATPR